MEDDKILCEKCNKKMSRTAFYTAKNSKPMTICKKCLTMHMNAFEPDTFLWALEKIDMPYIETEWAILRDRVFTKDPKKPTNHMSVFGKYLSKMRLNRFADLTWADTAKIEEAEREKKETEEEKEFNEAIFEKYQNGKISQAQYLTLAKSKDVYRDAMSMGPEVITGLPAPSEEIEIPDQGDTLTLDDKIYLKMKWGDTYSPNEWIDLERDYNDMMNSFDIQDADTLNTLKLLCKTTLKQNQALDGGDYDSYQKLSRVSETLRKTAKFTAQQNKDDKNNVMDTIGEFVTLCEREGGFIPRYVTDVPQDKIDLILKDMNTYVKKLVTQDLGFGKQIEDALKKIQMQKEMQQEEEEEEKDLWTTESDKVNGEEDYIEYFFDIQEQKDRDEEDN